MLPWPGPRFNIKMTSYQYRKFHCGDKTVVRSSYLHNGISYTGKMTSLYWIRAQYISHFDINSYWFPGQIVLFCDKTNHLIIIGYYMACNIQACLFSLPIRTSSINTVLLNNHENFMSLRNEIDCSFTQCFVNFIKGKYTEDIAIPFTLYGIYSNKWFLIFNVGNHVCDPVLEIYVAFFSRIL